ncbi:MAG: hypothetical protein WDZ29_03565 [Balneolaceae bacterium]
MLKNHITALASCVALLFGATACGPALVIQNVDYSQPVESVLSPASDHSVQDLRYAVSFSIQSILEEEGVDSVSEIRLIRGHKGYYFVTASGFSNVYVFEPGESELQLKTIINVAEEGLGQPAFNQRGDHIELIDRATGQTTLVTEEGIR